MGDNVPTVTISGGLPFLKLTEKQREGGLRIWAYYHADERGFLEAMDNREARTDAERKTGMLADWHEAQIAMLGKHAHVTMPAMPWGSFRCEDLNEQQIHLARTFLAEKNFRERRIGETSVEMHLRAFERIQDARAILPSHLMSREQVAAVAQHIYGQLTMSYYEKQKDAAYRRNQQWEDFSKAINAIKDSGLAELPKCYVPGKTPQREFAALAPVWF